VQNQNSKKATIAVFKKDDLTFDLVGMPSEFCYNYYVISYMLRDPTEGVPRDIGLPYVRRALPNGPVEDADMENHTLPAFSTEKLEMKVSPLNYRLMWEPDTTEVFVHNKEVQTRGLSGMDALREQRKARFQAKFVDLPSWSHDMSAEDVEKVKADYKSWVSGRDLKEEAKAEAETRREGTEENEPNDIKISGAKDEEMKDVTA